MTRHLIAAVIASLVVLGAPVGAAWSRAIDGFGGLRFGDPAYAARWLDEADWDQPDSVGERIYHAQRPGEPTRLAGVRLYWPGLLYRFFEGRLYAVAAEFPADAQAYDRLLGYLRTRYGPPDTVQSWRDAPPDTYLYRHHLRAAGWFSDDRQRSVWLIGDDDRGSLTVIDNSLSDVRAAAIGRSLAPRTSADAVGVKD